MANIKPEDLPKDLHEAAEFIKKLTEEKEAATRLAQEAQKTIEEQKAVIDTQNEIMSDQVAALENSAKSAPSALPTFKHAGTEYRFTVPQFRLEKTEGSLELVLHKAVDVVNDKKLLARLVEMRAGVIEEA